MCSMMSAHPRGQSRQIMTEFVEENSRVWKRGEIQGAVEHRTCEPHVAVPSNRLSHDQPGDIRVFFLVADSQLYKRLCPSVGPSVGPSVRWSVRGDRVGKCENAHFRPCPPVRNWYWPCIRPCFILKTLIAQSLEMGDAFRRS